MNPLKATLLIANTIISVLSFAQHNTAAHHANLPVQNPIDILIVGGQSNATGGQGGPGGTPGDSLLTPVPEDGTAFAFYKHTWKLAKDPVGNARNASMWPAFSIIYYNLNHS